MNGIKRFSSLNMCLGPVSKVNGATSVLFMSEMPIDTSIVGVQFKILKHFRVTK